MNDALSRTVEEIRQSAKSAGLRVFFGWLAEYEGPTIHWNEDHGGDWKSFLECAKSLNAKIVYLNWAPFEQFQVDEAVSEMESELAENEGLDDETKTIRKRLNELGEFKAKVGLTCVIDLAFVADGAVHIYQKTADWFDEFEDLLPEDENDDESREERKPTDRATVDRWATVLASDAKYMTCKGSGQREYLLERLAGEEFRKLPTYEILSRAETIFQVEFRQAAEETLSIEIRRLRDQGLNVNAIALKLGMSKDRVSGLLSCIQTKVAHREAKNVLCPRNVYLWAPNGIARVGCNPSTF